MGVNLLEGLSLAFPWSVWECWWLAPLALVLDLWLGDPALPWRHPVCLVGKLLEALERPARRFMLAQGTGRERGRGRLAGAAALFILIACAGVVVWCAVSLPVLGLVAAVYLAWAGLAMGSLLQTGHLVLERVEQTPVAGARQALAWLVSRDTSVMDRPLMRKTLADTLSENLTDAFTAPFFWLLVGGPVALWCYKAVSTTDSMWGYMTDKWRWLGWAGARADDVLAFVPARLAALSAGLVHALYGARQRLEAKCQAAGHGDASAPTAEPTAEPTTTPTTASPTSFGAAYLPGRWSGRWPGVAVVARQAAGMPSPNSGWPMTACAWLCGARMAGPSVYFGELVDKPWLGPPPQAAAPAACLAAWDAPRLLTLCALLRQSALYGGLALWLLTLACHFIF
ncbi:MAG: cobalamin biosynthesis protein [Desulfovibrio sp.]|nr:cobalamin biosynthesis protein [Desulfovibrio sp.]